MTTINTPPPCNHVWTLESRERNDHRCVLCRALGWRGLGSFVHRAGGIKTRMCNAKCGRVATVAVVASQRKFFCQFCVAVKPVRVAS